MTSQFSCVSNSCLRTPGEPACSSCPYSRPSPYSPARLRESDIQRALLAQLNALPRVHVDRINVALARGPSRTFRTAPIGFPDLIGCAAGHPLAIECKSATGRQRPEQRRWQQRFEAAGGIYIIARDVAETVARVRELLR